MKIINLKEEPQHINTLAAWHHAEWSYLNLYDTVEERAKRMLAYLAEDAVPSTFICKSEGYVLGSAAIVKHDMDTHKELSPWLASVYVNENCRRQGIGSKLVLHVMQYAKKLGVDQLYLFNDGKKDFYSTLGWTVLSEENYRGINVTIMNVTL